jgi:uncharacterized protein YndB with AHSA1/START domain
MSTGRCSVRLTRRYAATPAEVWSALTEPVSLARWLGKPEWAEAGGLVREVQPERVLELDWQPAGEDLSLVRVELSRDGDATLLVLDHRLVEARLGMTYSQHWTVRLDRLERQLG